ncbi:MAG: CoA-binding protein [Verrucomicrobiales bacterium]|nr:CoA-binding protein [Verrucomicrobiales bacterium]
MSEKKETVVVLGASDKTERYSNQAQRLLSEYGHEVIPVHPALKKIEGLVVVPNLAAISNDTKIDTLTLYVSAAISANLSAPIIQLHPGRVIFNPGTENPELMQSLLAEGIPCEEACTLVLLRTGQF